MGNRAASAGLRHIWSNRVAAPASAEEILDDPLTPLRMSLAVKYRALNVKGAAFSLSDLKSFYAGIERAAPEARYLHEEMKKAGAFFSSGKLEDAPNAGRPETQLFWAAVLVYMQYSLPQMNWQKQESRLKNALLVRGAAGGSTKEAPLSLAEIFADKGFKSFLPQYLTAPRPQEKAAPVSKAA